ncbi:hypothetical protein FA95DRAFT_1558202 [Auriscalpium vulgare]|uniref:Uncharacterized protein n=1 Tax=Auriscalpium vulgare TaxID=40419 RepID=A0ACB8RVW6_9AGAM|nr:hypothetical protein FA95DRAFT_1558202 [Auriscalpium vulgare]
MMRRMLRIPFFRTIVPSRPLLPVSRLASKEVRSLTRIPRISSTRLFHSSSPVRLSSPPPSPSHDTNEPTTLSARLKTLIKGYGWYALGVYAAVSVVDFGLSFAGINLLGAEYVSSVVASAKDYVYGLVYSRPPEPGREGIEDAAKGAAAGQDGEGLYAMLVLAYIVHKTLMPVRIGVTAAFTPRLVRWLRQRGWAGGEGTKRAAREMRERFRD